MHLKKHNFLAQSLLLATILSSGLIASACSAESSSISVLSNQSTPSEIYELGLAYYDGDSVPEDDDKAFELFQKAADQGYEPAQHHIGIMYHEGIGVDQDYRKAFEWVQRAAIQGYSHAQTDLTIMYESGKGIDQNYEKAMKWYLLSANNIDPSSASVDAQGNIGTMYYFGRGVPQSYTKALGWYRKAATQDSDMAQLNIGGLYENGYGVPQDYEEAFEWYKKAADQEASNRIGRLVMNGKIDDTGITIYRTQETGLTLGDIKEMGQ